MSIFTFEDALNHAVDFLGGSPAQAVLRDCRRAAEAAYKDLVNAYTWSYLYKHGRVITNGSWDSSQGPGSPTIRYQATGGAYPHLMTLSGGVWPQWAGEAYIRIALVTSRVDRRISDTLLTIDPMVHPVSDLPAGTGFVIYQDTYELPPDFVAMDQSVYEVNYAGMLWTHPKEWLYSTRYNFFQSNPVYVTVTGDEKHPGSLVIRMFPVPFESRTIDFIYKRRPRELTLPAACCGTATIPLGDTNLIGVGTSFTPDMVGAVVRLSSNATAPSSLVMGTNVAAFETRIDSYVSPTQVVLADPAPQRFDAVGLAISDPIDIEQGVMLEAYLRGIEKHLTVMRSLKDKPGAAAFYREALSAAKAADSRSFMGKKPDPYRVYYPRLRDWVAMGSTIPEGS